MKARNKNNSTNNNNNAAKKSAAAVGDASTDGALEVLESPFGGADTSMALKRNTSSTASLKMTKANSIKLTIKPLTTPVALPADFEATLWKKLDAAVDAIFRAERAAHPQEELYRAVQDLCTNKMDNELYRKLEKKCNAHVESSLEQLQSSNTTGQQYLALVGKVWDTHCRETQTIKTVFGCLDRAVMLQGGTRMPLWELGVDAFRTHFSKREAVVQKVLDLFYAEVKAERNGTLCDRAVMKKLSNMFTVLSLYPKLEAGLLAGAKEFYTDEGNETARTEADKSCKDYLHLVERRLHEEADRVSAYLNLETKKPLITLVETHLVADHVEEVLGTGFVQLMEARLVPELALLYKHMNLPNVQRTEALRNALKMYVKEKGTKRVSDESLDASLIQDLLTFKAWLDDIVTRAFGDKKDFIYVVRDAFENFLALRDVAPPSLLAKFIDGKMKVGNRESDKEVDAVLDQCLDIFRMISSKDVFEALYCKDFARRLLLGRCASMDTERVFISKLKVESGSGFTSKLEGMVKDLETSKEVTAEYESPEGVPPLSVLVLTELHWPQYQSCQVMLPKALSECLNHFKTFYTTKHRGRRLVWQSCLCTATVKATYAKGKKELIVSLLQALTLLVYNTEDQVTFGKIQELVGTRDQDLTRAVQGLIFAQARILKRKTKGTGRDLQASDVIEVNEDFQSKHFRVKINGMQMKDTDDTMQNTMKKVSEDRVAAIDACLVRTMKSKKTLTHPELMASCVAQLKFRTKPEDVKKRIEMLIEREYLRRDDNKQSIYHYIA